MSKFDKIAAILRQAALSENLEEKSAVLELTRADGFYDDFTEDQRFVLQTMSSDIFSGRLELLMTRAAQVAS
jgi:hypothetical protein